jgi:hypothetical protein
MPAGFGEQLPGAFHTLEKQTYEPRDGS